MAASLYPDQALQRSRAVSFSEIEVHAQVTDFKQLSTLFRSASPPRDKSSKKQQKHTPLQHTPGYLTTRDRVIEAARNVVGNSGLVVHELLSLSPDLLKFAPVPGLAEAARVLLRIWDALELVDSNRKGWLHLLDRCATVLLSVRSEILQAGGDVVSRELAPALDNLTMVFLEVYRAAQMQQERPFIKRYLQREEIEHALSGCHKQVDEALAMFNMSIQIHILKQVMHIEVQQRADASELLQLINHNASCVHLGDHSGALAVASTSDAPPTTSALAMSHSPPPATHDNDDPCTGSVRQSERDPALHSTGAELRQLMRAALQANNDSEMLRVLQLGCDEMPEAYNALQRAFHLEHSGAHDASATRGRVLTEDTPPPAARRRLVCLPSSLAARAPIVGAGVSPGSSPCAY